MHPVTSGTSDFEISLKITKVQPGLRTTQVGCRALTSNDVFKSPRDFIQSQIL